MDSASVALCLFLGAGVGATVGCRRDDAVRTAGPSTPANARRFQVRMNGNISMEVDDFPGVLRGPGCKPPAGKVSEGEPHPFLSGVFHESSAEVREALTASKSTNDFLSRLRSRGYEIQQITGPRPDGGGG